MSAMISGDPGALPSRTDDEDADWGDDDNGGRCHWCGGDGWDECDDPIECTSEHDDDDYCRCKSCGGSGLAKDMTIW